MPLERFNLQNLPQVDSGKVAAAFDQELKRVIADCQDRPMEDKPRTVTLRFSVIPRLDKSSHEPSCDDVDVGIDLESRVPAQKTKLYTMRAQADHGLLFRPEVPEDPDQMELEDARRERPAVERAKK